MQTFGYYVAIEEKLFEKHGIELESVRFQAPDQIIDSLVSGRADAGAPGAAAGISVLAEVQFLPVRSKYSACRAAASR